MAKYQSHLEALIKVRTYREEVVYRELLEQENLLTLEKTALHDLIESTDAAVDRLSQYQKKGGSPTEIQTHYDFIKSQGLQIKTQEEKIALQDEAVERKRLELNEVVQEKKIVEKLEARQKAAYIEKLKKQETFLLDEIASQRKMRTT
ncbi:MAG: flagellar export protein FliJ [Nitrospirota bacterium]|nr:flagellar export protein FliJ [Nitrospirota bacterium]